MLSLENKMNKVFQKFLAFFLLVVVALITVTTYKAFILNQPCRHKLKKLDPSNKIVLDQVKLTRFRHALRYQTVSYDKDNQNQTALHSYIKFIRQEFKELETLPFVTLQVVNELSLLYEIRGSDVTLKPYLLAAHSDVVPVESQLDRWSFDPFGADISDGYIYARGTMDDKSSMLSQLEAVSYHVKKHGQPRRSIYLAYGHDEEIHGFHGAGAMADRLKNISMEFVIDEGTIIIEDAFENFDRPVAMISNAEKGYLTIKFFVNATGGHSSMPSDNNSAIFILSDAVQKLKNNKLPSLLGYGPEKDMFEKLAVYMDPVKRILLSNLWLFKPIVERIFEGTTFDVFQRTTTAVTMFHAGFKENVIATSGEFVVNHRIHSLQSCQDVLEHDLRVINDKRVEYEIIECTEPAPVSPTDSLAYRIIEHSTLQVFTDTIPISSVMIGLSDSRFYTSLSENIYRFLPIKMKQKDLKRYHGIDERISVQDYENLINFFYVLVQNSDTAHLDLDFYKKDEL